MTARHTPGELKQLSDCLYISGENGGNICTVSDPRRDRFVGWYEARLGDDGFDEAMANAERIVAVWNACDGLSDEEIEGGVVPKQNGVT